MATNNIGAPFSLMTDQPSIPEISRATWVGLFLSLFAMVVIRYAFVFFVPEITFAAAILKETLIWASAAALLVIIRRGEGLSFRSIGLGTCRWWKSIAWGFVIAVVSAAVVGGRAGVVEELFYRGYAIERLRMIGLGPFWSVTIPLVIFSLGHWSGGAANILIAFAAGIILTGFYLWRRDLVANMIGHGLVDFVANVVP